MRVPDLGQLAFTLSTENYPTQHEQAIAFLTESIGAKPGQIEQGLEMLRGHSDETPAYISFGIPKRSGGTREIRAPIEPLMTLMRLVYDELLIRFPLNRHIHGYRPRHSIVTNAKVHLRGGAVHAVGFDIKDCFPSTTIDSIRLIYRWTVGNLLLKEGIDVAIVEEVIEILASLSTLRYGRAETEVLPMGSPSSPALLNLALQAFDTKLSRKLKAIGDKDSVIFNYTRYGDDLTVSSAKPLPNSLFSLVPSLLAPYGYRLNQSKTKVMQRGKVPIEVTGLIVAEDRLLLPDQVLQNFEMAIIKLLSKKTLSKAQLRFMRGILGLCRMVYEGKLPKRLAGAIETMRIRRAEKGWSGETVDLCLTSPIGDEGGRPRIDYKLIQALRDHDVGSSDFTEPTGVLDDFRLSKK